MAASPTLVSITSPHTYQLAWELYQLTNTIREGTVWPSSEMIDQIDNYFRALAISPYSQLRPVYSPRDCQRLRGLLEDAMFVFRNRYEPQMGEVCWLANKLEQGVEIPPDHPTPPDVIAATLQFFHLPISDRLPDLHSSIRLSRFIRQKRDAKQVVAAVISHLGPGTKPNSVLVTRLVRVAAELGFVDTATDIRAKLAPTLAIGEPLISGLAFGGHLDLLQKVPSILRDQVPDWELLAAGAAARSGRLEVLQWLPLEKLREHIVSRLIPTCLCYGHLHIFEWLLPEVKADPSLPGIVAHGLASCRYLNSLGRLALSETLRSIFPGGCSIFSCIYWRQLQTVKLYNPQVASYLARSLAREMRAVGFCPPPISLPYQICLNSLGSGIGSIASFIEILDYHQLQFEKFELRQLQLEASQQGYLAVADWLGQVAVRYPEESPSPPFLTHPEN